MDFKELYEKKLTTAEKAAEVVKSGDWIDYGWCANTPVAFDAALAKRAVELHDCAAVFLCGYLKYSRLKILHLTLHGIHGIWAA